MEKTNLSYPKGQFINLVNRDEGVHIVQEEHVVQNGNKERQRPVDHRSGQMEKTSQQSQPHVGAVSVQLLWSPPFQVRCLLPTPTTPLLGPIHCCSCRREKINKIKWKQIHFLKWSRSWIKLIGKSLSAEIRIHIALRSCSKVDWRGFKRLEPVGCTKAVSLSWSQAVGSWGYDCLLLSSLPCPLPCNVLCYPASRRLIQLFKSKVTGGIKLDSCKPQSSLQKTHLVTGIFRY